MAADEPEPDSSAPVLLRASADDQDWSGETVQGDQGRRAPEFAIEQSLMEGRLPGRRRRLRLSANIAMASFSAR